LVADLTEQAAARADALAARMAAIGPVPPVPVSEMRSDLLGWGATRQEAEERFESVPTLDPTFKLPFRDKQQVVGLRAGFSESDFPVDEAGSEPSSPAPAVEPVRWTWQDAAPAPEPAGMSPANQTPDAAGFAAPSGRPLGEDRSGPSRWTDVRPARRHRRAARPDEEPMTLPELGEVTESLGRYDWVDEPISAPVVASAQSERSVWPADRVSAEALPEDQIARDIPPIQVPDVALEPFDEWLEEPAFLMDVPRCCRTCRDFRPADGGERGWCNSAWAFQHRRVVHADELPCASAIGSWWLPHDDVWLDALDVDHAQPTPLIETMLARLTAGARREARGARRGARH
jgi:hypothetical protein